MRIEFEISDEDLRAALHDTIRTQVNSVLAHWSVRDQVEKMVQQQWPDAIRGAIDEMASNHVAIRAKIAEEIARKLRAQVAAALKQAQAE